LASHINITRKHNTLGFLSTVHIVNENNKTKPFSENNKTKPFSENNRTKPFSENNILEILTLWCSSKT